MKKIVMLCLCLAGSGFSETREFLLVIEDSEVKQFDADINFGALPTVKAQKYDDPAKCYFKFDASSLGIVTNVGSLRMVSTALYGRNAKFYLIIGNDADSWDEGSITWNNAPGNNISSAYEFATNGVCVGVLLGTSGIVNQGEEVALVWDSLAAKGALLDALNNGNRIATIASSRNGDRYVQFASRENTIYQPTQLELNSNLDTNLTDHEFFSVLNLDYPGLENVKTAYNRGDIVAAKGFLCAYFRNRGNGYWWNEAYAVPDEADGESALETYQKIVDKIGEFAPEYWLESGEFNWEAKDDYFRRMYFFSALGTAYRYSGNEEIVEMWVDLYCDWILQVSGSWNRLSAGIRLRSGWGDAFSSFVASPSLTDQDIFLFIKAYYEQALYLRENHSETSNWLTFEMAGLYSTGVLFPELLAAGTWRDYALQVASTDLDRGWLPDGISIELAPGYGQFFSNYLHIYDLAEEVGYRGETLSNLVAKTERLYSPYLEMMTPSREYPGLNDNVAGDVTIILEEAAARFPDRQDFLWGATGGAEGIPPDYLSVAFPYAGYCSIRSGWEVNANYLIFDAGPVGYRHAHQDKLQVVLWAYGREILYDPGRQEYDETDPYQQYCLDTFSHSTGLVDNRPQRRKWYQDPNPDLFYPYRTAEGFDAEIGDGSVWVSGLYSNSYGLAGSITNHAYPYTENSNFYDGWGSPASHYRQFAYASPDIFVVQDWFEPEDGASHDYEIRWQLDSVLISSSGTRAETVDSEMPNLAVIPLWSSGLQVNAVSAMNSPEIMGWKVLESAYPATALRHMKTGSGNQGFLTLLLPLKAGDSSETVRFSEQGGIITLNTHDGREFIITPAQDLGGRLSVVYAGYTDSDADGLPDWWEEEYYTDPTNANSTALCSNSINTLEEAYIAGLDPLDPLARFDMSHQWQNGSLDLSWETVSGRTYTVRWSTNLLEGFLETNVPWSEGAVIVPADGNTGFYQLKVRMEE